MVPALPCGEGMGFRNRTEAGQRLAGELAAYKGREDVVVLGIPRGGVPVAAAIASALGVPLDIFLSRKLGVPGDEELAFGAVAANDETYIDDFIVKAAGVTPEQIQRTVKEVRQVLEERAGLYRKDRRPVALQGRTVILVDDGVATGASMLAAIRAMRQDQPKQIVLAVPVAPAATASRLERVVDASFVLERPADFLAVGQFYADFRQVSDAEVVELLEGASQTERRPAP